MVTEARSPLGASDRARAPSKVLAGLDAERPPSLSAKVSTTAGEDESRQRRPANCL